MSLLIKKWYKSKKKVKDVKDLYKTLKNTYVKSKCCKLFKSFYFIVFKYLEYLNKSMLNIMKTSSQLLTVKIGKRLL